MPGTLPQTTPSGRAASPRFRALVVDDERVIRTLLRRVLTRAEFDVVEAANGQVALNLLRRGDFDLVVTDVQMPIMGGLELLEHLKLQQPELPIVVLSGHFELANGQSPVELGAFALLKKPFSIEEIQKTALGAINARTQVMPGPRSQDGTC
jgi:two-component system, NtrC family, nitrogen regulation response regulator NtrX